MRILAQHVLAARGWRRCAIAGAAGAVGALAMPPFGLVPLLAVSLAPAIWLLDGIGSREQGLARDAAPSAAPALPRVRDLRAAAALGWCWGFGYFVAGLWWLGAAFLVEAEEFAWAMPFGVLGLPALLAFFPAFGFALARTLWSPGWARLFAFAAALTASEWLRGHLFTGFPWNSPGMALAQHLWPMQAASMVGLYGLTLLAVLLGAAPASLGTGRSGHARWLPPAVAALALAGLLGHGALRVPADALPPVAGARLRIMQPNLPQDAKFNPRNGAAILHHYLTLSAGRDGRSLDGITHVVWPESAFPFLLHRDPEALARIAEALPRGTTLVTGAARMGDPLPGEEAGRFFNAVQVIAEDGTITASYDKSHLVPFGEYVPGFVDALIRAVGLREFVHIPGGFSPAERQLPLLIPGLPPVAASVCYEAIFPGAVLPEGPRPSLILNVTNDAWFGATPGPHQHFAQARLRAVEEGLPLVRAANTGISAVVDPFGRVLQALPLGIEGILDSDVPVALPATLYSRYGDRILGLLLLVCLALSLMARPRRQPVPARA